MPTRRPGPFLFLFGLVVLLAACGSDEPDEAQAETGAGAAEAPIVVLGDSIMEWNADDARAIPDVIGAQLGRDVVSAAFGGALATDVPDQYASLGDIDPAWVVFDGGGNDLNDSCGCGSCEDLHDDLISADGTSGMIPDFADTVVADGARVALVGYYEIPAGALFGFDRCADELTEHNRRLAAAAALSDEIIFVSPADVVQADDLEAFDDDLVHPSVEGSRIVGEQIAEAITAAG